MYLKSIKINRVNRHIFLLFFVLILGSSELAFSQSLVNVSQLTGTVNIDIPVFTIKSGSVAIPIALVYSSTGIKPKDIEGTAGMGWQLSIGGQISRVVRGIPDDCSADNKNNPMLGWMSASNSGANYINSLIIKNVRNTNCSNETTDINNINANIPNNNDTEPDLFYVNAPGLSCQLVYDRASNSFKPINYQDITISYSTLGSGTGNGSRIGTFTITNDKGIKYLFIAGESVSETTSIGSGTVNYFSTKYNQYKNGITYNSTWVLNSITDPSGNGVALSYTNATPRGSTDPIILYLGGSTTSSLQYSDLMTTTPLILSSIATFNATNSSVNVLNFNWLAPDNPGSGQTMISTITGQGHFFTFNYSGVKNNSSGYIRYFLRNFTDPGCSTPVNYTFSYIGETNSVSAGYTTALPDSSSTQLDYWGYYSATAATNSLIPSVYVNNNPDVNYFQRYLIKVTSLPGSAFTYTLSNNNRAVDPANVMIGALNVINYPQGGSSTITYESNDYFDQPSNSVVFGNGIRVKQIDDKDNLTGQIITRKYSYLNQSGVSSGKPISLPQFAFTMPFGTAYSGLLLYTQCTALSAFDLSNEDHTIMYTSSRVTQTGAGSILYNYNVPASCWDNAASPSCAGCTTTEWQPSSINVARYSCGSNYGPLLSNFFSTYPFIPNPNYDFERGLPISEIDYNDAGTEVSETDYTYQRTSAPSIITAFKNETSGPTNLMAKFYNKYYIYYNTGELASTVTKKVFDSPTLSQAQSSVTSYTYGSSYHKLPTKRTSTNSDGNIVTTNITYTKDYPAATAGTNANINALYFLQQKNINLPVETYQQVTRNGTTYFNSGTLTLFNGFTNGGNTNYLASQQFKFVQPNGVTSFNPLTINSAAQTIAYDTRYYFPVANYTSYDGAGYLQTADDAHKSIGTTIVEHSYNNLIASFKNAAFGEVAFSDFDSQLPTQSTAFTIIGTGTPNIAGHTGLGYTFGSGQSLSKSLTKNALAQNYIFSIWINSNASGNINISLSNGTSTNNYTLPYTNTVGVWKYFEFKVPVTAFSTAFSITVTSPTSIVVDDVIFYPDVAEVTTYAYDPVSHYKIAQTNTNGVSVYFSNDNWGRLTFAFDQDKNIVQKNSYLTPIDVASYNNPVISGSNSIPNGQSAGFGISGPNPCAAAGTTVNWNFGDGTPSVTASGLVSPSHTFSGALGTVYQVQATVNSPLIGSKVLTPFPITVVAANVAISYTNYTLSNGNISAVLFTSTTGGASYSFNGTTLKNAVVLQGKYTITVSISGGTLFNAATGSGYRSIALGGSCSTACSNFATTNNYTFTVDLSSCTSLSFTVAQTACGI